MTFALTLLAASALVALLSLPETAQGVAIYRNSTDLTDEVLASACRGQMDYTVCDPYSRRNRYVQCNADRSKPSPRMCSKGKVYDYIKRKCVSATADWTPCPMWDCPVDPLPDNTWGNFGEPGNHTFTLDQADEFMVFNPTNNHCLGGMIFNVFVSCDVYMGNHTPEEHLVVWDEFVAMYKNSQNAPMRLPDINATCGDTLRVEWIEPVHLVSSFNKYLPQSKHVLVYPYPPQPVFKCPDWKFVFDEGNPLPHLVPKANEIKIAPLTLGPANFTWAPNTTGTWYFVCPEPSHCRVGVVFRTMVLPPTADMPAGTVHNVSIHITGSNMPELTMALGDSIYFWWPPYDFHALSTFKHLDWYFPKYGVVDF